MLFDPTSLAVCGGVTSVLAVVSALGVYTAYSLDDNESRTSRSGDGLLTAISAGVVLSVAWLHLLDDAQLMLKDLTMYPAANTAMMVGFLLMSVIHAQSSLKETQCHHYSAWGGNVMLLPASAVAAKQSQKPAPDAATRFHLMEAAISFHSFLIGLGVGFAQDGWESQLVLGVALTLHQFLEGAAVGAVGRRSNLSRDEWQRAFLMFSLSLPLGVACAVSVELLSKFDPTNVGYLWTSGLLNAFAAGTLTHIGMEMVTHELDNLTGESRPASPAPMVLGQKDVPERRRFAMCAQRVPCALSQSTSRVMAICLGTTIMAVLAVWA